MSLEDLYTNRNLAMLFVLASHQMSVLLCRKAHFYNAYVCLNTHTHTVCVYMFVSVTTWVGSVSSKTFGKIFTLGLFLYFSELLCGSSVCWLLQHYPIKNNIIRFLSCASNINMESI